MHLNAGCNIALDLKSCLIQERLKRNELEKRLTALEAQSVTDQSICSQQQKLQLSVQPDSTMSCVSSKRNVRMSTAPSRCMYYM